MNLTVFKKNPLLLYALTAVVALALVWFPVINTVSLVNRYMSLQNLPDAAAVSQAHMRQANEVEALLTDEDQSKKIFNLLSASCQTNHVIVRQVEVPRVMQVNDIEVNDQKIMLEGRFTDILKSIDGISKELAPIKIASVVFELEHNTGNREKILVSHVIFKSVKIPAGYEQDR
jgi:hypothetical protein